MPRLLHMADVHLGARHDDLGDAAAQQRERQFAAFSRAVDAAIERRVDVVLICGDLFDSNAQPRRSVERAVGELARLAERHIRAVLIPGTHDCYDGASIYRAFDLPAMAGLPTDSDLLTVLTPDVASIFFRELDLEIHGPVFPTKSAPRSPLDGFRAGAVADPATNQTRGSYQVGMIHGSLRLEGKVTSDDVLFTSEEIAASGLHYLALGHWHSLLQGKAGSTVWAYSGAPEPVALDQDGAGQVLLVTIDGPVTTPHINVESIAVGRTRFQHLDVDVGSIASQDDLCRRLRELADPDLVLDVRLLGVAPDSLDLDTDEVGRQVRNGFFRFRLRDTSIAALPDGPLPPADTIAGVLARDLRTRIAAAETAGTEEVAAETREALHLLRVLLDEPRRVTLV
ncbi:MAG: DNA repair exonuclease [Chloroflexota bacterium]|nr:DNA repair exonuclease [Chloroflexota bacterium]